MNSNNIHNLKIGNLYSFNKLIPYCAFDKNFFIANKDKTFIINNTLYKISFTSSVSPTPIYRHLYLFLGKCDGIDFDNKISPGCKFYSLSENAYHFVAEKDLLGEITLIS